MKLTAQIIKEYQNRKRNLKTIGEFKELGRELKNLYGLTDREAIDLLNGKNELDILAKNEGNNA